MRSVHRGVAVCSQDNPAPEPDDEAHQETQDIMYNPASDPEFDLSSNEPMMVDVYMLQNAVESSAMPVDQTCLLCSELAVFRCQECGSSIYYCYQCFSKQHEKVNIFYTAEKWKVILMYVQAVDSLITIWLQGRSQDLSKGGA